MNIFDVYGLNESTLEEACNLVEKALQIRMQAHESSYHCGNYFRLDLSNGANLILQQNYDSFDGEWTEESFKSSKYLLYVSKHDYPDEIKSLMLSEDSRVSFLRRDEIL